MQHKYLNQAVQSISESVRFDSSKQPAEAGKPFGQGAYDCLCHFLSLAEEMGFQTNNYDGYVGEVVYGEGKDEFAVLAHLDVVPAGSGWNKDPFGGIVEDGRIWGRGTVDDKGPAVCCLYALKSMKDKGIVPAKKIKLIVGCNEEDGWECIKHYNRVAHMPEYGFSPDADFPVIYSEKGILHVRFHFPVIDGCILKIEGGKAANMVCDYCEALPATLSEPRAQAAGLKIKDNKLYCEGKSAHGSTPELGENAILPVLSYFAEESADVRRIVDCLFHDAYGLKKLHDDVDTLTLSPNVIRFSDGEAHITCDIRYPASMNEAQIRAALDKLGAPYDTISRQAPLRQEKDGELISTLLSVYQECTGQTAEPVSIGGGTYARALKFGAAFGPEMAGDEPVVHMPNEYITVERVNLLLEIYEKALIRLTSK